MTQLLTISGIGIWSFTLFPPIVAFSAETPSFSFATPLIQQKGHAVPGASFQVFVNVEQGKGFRDEQHQRESVSAVVKALGLLIERRHEHARVDEALKEEMLERVVIEPRVINRAGKEFPFLVARTQRLGKVKLLVNAERLEQNGHLKHPDRLMVRLAKEFQWVVSKARTSVKSPPDSTTRDLRYAPIHKNSEIRRMLPDERKQALLQLFENYLTTTDGHASLANQPY